MFKAHDIKQLFWGSTDRKFSSISVLASIISVIISIFLICAPEKIPFFIICRDVLIFLALILIIILLVRKYYLRELEIKEIDNQVKVMLSYVENQLHYSNDITQRSLQEIFIHYKPIFQKITEMPVTKEEYQIFNDICSSVTRNVRDSLKEYFRFNNLDIGEDISVSVKLISPPQNIIKYHGNHFPENKETLLKNGEWVITAYRDPYTYDKNKTTKKREVISYVYSIDGNTAFRNIIKSKDIMFCENNLQDLFSRNVYRNENLIWDTLYNSTLVVPMVLEDSHNEYKYIGFLAVDSLNPNCLNLYNKNETYWIMHHAAMVLSIFYLAIVLYHDRE
jgi:hypothetical protein